jgi:hypothetical protein
MLSDDFNPNFPNRQAKLKAYLAVYGPTVRELARRLNVSPVRAHAICHSERVQKRTLEILLESGIPAELLPEPAKREAATAAAARQTDLSATEAQT